MASDALLAAYLNASSEPEVSPYSQSGASILQSQLPKATNNTEAILGPILQGLIGGGLYGYGQGQTNKNAFNAYAQNPILQSLGGDNPLGVGPVASGDEYAQDLLANAYAGEMPSGWTAKQGKTDLISALMTKQAIDEDEAAKAAFREKVALAGATEQAKQEARQGFEVMPGVPKEFKSEVLKERSAGSTLQQSLDYIDNKFEAAKKLTGGSAALTANTGLPTKEGNELEALADSVIVQIDKAIGREVNSDVRKRMLSLAPKWYDSSNEIDKKRENLKELVKSLSPTTPISDSLGIKPVAAPNVASTVVIPAKPKASDLMAQGYTKGPNGWEPPRVIITGAPRG